MLTVYSIEDDLEHLSITKQKLECYLNCVKKGNFRTNLIKKLITVQRELFKLEQRRAME